MCQLDTKASARPLLHSESLPKSPLCELGDFIVSLLREHSDPSAIDVFATVRR
jgi:hypothetical protein